MKKILLTAACAFGFAACGGDGSSCDQLSKKICDGQDDAYCEKVDGWLADEMVGPDGEQMKGDMKEQACKMILDDDNVTELYKKQASRQLGG